MTCSICGEYALNRFSTQFAWTRVARVEGYGLPVKHRICNDCIKKAVRQQLEILGRF